LLSLLREPEERLGLLDEAAVIAGVKTLGKALHDPLPCYIEVRQRLLGVGIRNREMAIYLANIWIGYRESGILPDLGETSGEVMETVDILRELNFVKGYEKFELLAMSGNYYLFLMAFFEGYFRDLEKLSGKPALAYYEAFARIAFRAARDHGLSEEFELWTVYDELCDRFNDVRTALAGLK
ncbi:MAG TPA: hypothetical protein VJ960_10055, partial [Oceanipulchritudo sp.]|nr:hypothetical protein [Oceanipulchritudo sp.]